MKRVFPWLFLFSILWIYQVPAQHTSNYNDNWCFTNFNTLKFTSGSPVNVAGCPLDDANYGSSSVGVEGVSSISDGNGNLLFYSDGMTVYDATNTAMPNGNGNLNGYYSATSSTLITKVPGSCTEYYIFQLSKYLTLSNRLYYSIVDMSLVGNGTGPSPLGDVVSGTINIPLNSDTLAEKMVAIQKGVTENYWIVLRSAVKDVFYAYEVDRFGINAVPISSVVSGATYPPPPSAGSPQSPFAGWLAVSPQNDAIAEVGGLGHSFLYDFNSLSGSVTNQDTLVASIFTSPAAPYEMIYGIEFSPNGQYIYLGANTSASSTIIEILQFDRSAGFGNVKGTRVQTSIVSSASSESVGTMSLAKDGKIYFVTKSQNSISVINNPNNWAAPGINYAAFPLSGGISGYSLANDFHYFQEPILPTNIAGNDTNLCSNGPVNLGCSSCDSIEANYFWEPAGLMINPNNANSQTISLTTSQQFILSVTYCGDTVITDTVEVTVAPFTSIITPVGYILTAQPSGGTYQWLDCDNNYSPIAGETNQSFTATANGSYSVEVTQNNCTDTSDCQTVTIIGLQENKTNAIHIYPNPTTGLLTIKGVEGIASVYDIYGRLVLTTKTNTLDISNTAMGIYFVRVVDEQGKVFVGKVLKE